MAAFSAEVIGVGPLLRKLARALSAPVVGRVEKAAAERIRDRLKTYPPERPNQQYERTGTLGAGWAVEPEGDGVAVSNAVAYGPFVQSADDQAAVHQGRWTTDEQAVAAEIGPFARALGAEVDVVFHGG